MDKIKIFDSFAGYGGASFGIKKAGIPHEVIGYSEIHPQSCKIYELNHPGIKNYGDMTKINPNELPNFNLLTGGFPCQAFSSAGKMKGELDPRGTLFYEIIKIAEIKKPEYMLLENVKGLTTNRFKETFQKILSELNRIGYYVYWKLLNSKNYGIPKNRERVWFVCFRDKNKYEKFKFPEEEELKIFFKDLLEENPNKKYYKNQEQAKRLIEITKVNLDVKEPSCFDIYNKKIREDKISVTLTEPHHNTLRVVEPIKDGQFMVRKMTEKEHFRFMGFKDGEINFGDLSYAQLCRCAGNGWDINIASKIMKEMNKLF
jgi:DNA (cytosine-5)-methyltransferase 1